MSRFGGLQGPGWAPLQRLPKGTWAAGPGSQVPYRARLAKQSLAYGWACRYLSTVPVGGGEGRQRLGKPPCLRFLVLLTWGFGIAHTWILTHMDPNSG